MCNPPAHSRLMMQTWGVDVWPPGAHLQQPLHSWPMGQTWGSNLYPEQACWQPASGTELRASVAAHVIRKAGHGCYSHARPFQTPADCLPLPDPVLKLSWAGACRLPH